jgi:hypothetical protein
MATQVGHLLPLLHHLLLLPQATVVLHCDGQNAAVATQVANLMPLLHLLLLGAPVTGLLRCGG